MKLLYFRLTKIFLIGFGLLVSFVVFAQINRDFLTLKPVVSDGYPPGTVHCLGSPTTVVDVLNPSTGKTWMDRNLGASQVATSSTDALAYGDLYQWGRFSDGHQCRVSGTTSTNSATDTPGHDLFIMETVAPQDWRIPQNNSLWQGVGGVNNPCPTGYRLPTDTELDAERLSWSTQNAAGAFGSPLKWSMGGNREDDIGTFTNVGSTGFYWSSTVSATSARNLQFTGSSAMMNARARANGFSVRCIKE